MGGCCLYDIPISLLCFHYAPSSPEEARSELDSIIGSECPLCGLPPNER